MKRMCEIILSAIIAGALYTGCLDPAAAQNPTCPTRATGDNTNACASTAFVNNEIAASVPSLAQYHFFIGDASNQSTDTALAGDCTYGASGIICTKTNGTAFGALATLGLGTGFSSSGGNIIGSGTAGYAFTGNGASASSYQGFVQGSTTRTWQSKAADIVNLMDFYLSADGTDYALAIQRAHDSTQCANGCVVNITSSGNIATQVNVTRSFFTLNGLVPGAGSALQAPTLNVTYAAGPAFVFGSVATRIHSASITNLAFTQDAAVSQAMFYVQNVRGFMFRNSNANLVYEGFLWGNSASVGGTYIMNLLNSSVSIRATGTHCIEIPDGAGALYTEDFECYGPNTVGSYGIWFKSGNTRTRFDEMVLGRRTFFQFFDKAIFQDNTRVGNVTIVDGRYDYNITCFLCTNNSAPDATGGGFGSAVISGNQISSRPWVATGTAAELSDISFIGNKITTDNSLYLTAGAGVQSAVNLNFTGNIFNITPTIASIPTIYLTGTFNGLAFGANTFYTSGANPAQYAIDFSASFVAGGTIGVAPQGTYGFTASPAIHNNPNPLATIGGSNTQVQVNNSGVLAGSTNLTWISPALSIGNAGVTSGQLALGAAAGGLTIINPFASVTFNFNLPTTAGTTGQPLLSGGGGVTPMAWGTVSGSGNFAMTTSPAFTTPSLGVATATSVNKVALTTPATSSTLTVADGKTLTASNTLTFTGTDGSSAAFGAGGTVAYGANKSAFSVNKNGADQTGVADNTATQITFGTELYDVGSNFASDTWTPPAGKVAMTAAFLASGTMAAASTCAIYIYKNGSVYKAGIWFSGVNGCTASIAIDDIANGTDAYTVFGLIDVTSGTATISGSTINTYWMGHYLN